MDEYAGICFWTAKEYLYFFPQIALACFCYRGSYFKYRGEDSQIFWIRFGGGLPGRVSSEVTPDVCMGEGSQILICLGGAST